MDRTVLNSKDSRTCQLGRICNYVELELEKFLDYFLFQDLVKSHLMSAVRSEVEELRDKISKLEVNSCFSS